MEDKILDYDTQWQEVIDKMTFIENTEDRKNTLVAFLMANTRL